VVLLYLVFSQFFDDTRGYTQVSTSQALTQISDGNVSNAVIEDKEQQLRLDLKTPITTDNGKPGHRLDGQVKASTRSAAVSRFSTR